MKDAKPNPNSHTATWLSGGGEMGALIRQRDWSKTPLGPLDSWPQSLKTTIRLMLTTRHPVFIFWGPDLTCFYNDAYRQSIGPERHPSALGAPGREVWDEIWHIIGPQIDLVMAGKGATWHENHLVPITRHGRREDVYWTYSYGPIDDPEAANGVGGVLVLCTETTQQVVQEQALRQSEERFRAFVTASSDVVYRMSPDWSEMRYLTGKDFIADHDDPRSGWLDKYIHPDDQPRIMAVIDEAVQTKNAFELEHRVIKVDGSLGWAHLHAVPILDAHGEIVEWFGAARDVTERKDAEAALREREQRLRNVLDGMGECFGLMDHEFRIITQNKAALRLDRRLLEDIRGRTHWEVYPGSEESELGRLYKRAMAERVPVSLEHRYEWPGGGANWLEMRAFPVPEGLAVFWRDITARKQVEAALRESEEKYRAMFEFNAEGVSILKVLFDERGEAVDYRFLENNPAVERMTGVADAAGKTVLELFPDFDRQHIQTAGDVARTGRSVRFQHYVQPLDRWFDVHEARIGGEGSPLIIAAFADITARKREEERQAFLLKLSDALRPLADPAAIYGEACRLLAERFDVERAYYVDIDEAGGMARVERDFIRDGAASLAGEHTLASFAWSVAILRRGECHIVANTQDSPLVPPADRAACASLQIIACMGAPLIKEGGLVGALCVTAGKPRFWKPEEVILLQEVGERIWSTVERTRAETALRESEERFQLLAGTIEDVFYLLDLDHGLPVYVSPSYERVWQRPGSTAVADPSLFVEAMHPDDRAVVQANREALARGEPIAHEYRIVRPDGSLRWIYDRCFAVPDAPGHLAAGIAIDITERKTAEQALRDSDARQRVMVAELQHRTRNLIAVVRAIANQSLKVNHSLSEFKTDFNDRLTALSRVQGLLSQSSQRPVDIGAVVRLELEALGALPAGNLKLDGPEIVLRKSVVQTLALAIHELATNARKYGALAQEQGRLRVSWQVAERANGEERLIFEWRESEIVVQQPQSNTGYGRELIEKALPYSLQAETSLSIDENGVLCVINLPLEIPGETR